MDCLILTEAANEVVCGECGSIARCVHAQAWGGSFILIPSLPSLTSMFKFNYAVLFSSHGLDTAVLFVLYGFMLVLVF
jgi:hypothetical protein